jgi:transposase
MLADQLDYVVGVDTHRDEHVLALVAAPAGAVVAGKAVRANGRGYREALRFGERYAAGRRAWAIEGTGSYGAGLARYLAEQGETVLELSRTPRAGRRLHGKDDALDAGPHGAGGTRQRDAGAAASGSAARGAAVAAGRSSQRRRRPP